MLKTIAFIKGHKWTSMMVKRVYFGNWLRDYSQAMDVGTLKSVQADTIRILLWILSFLTFGYATEEFEVTAERLGVYRPEEHIDNPKDYADNKDAREFDPRLRPPIQQIELDIDPRTGMKNYIANDTLGIATSSGYVRFSLTRSIHFGRMYTNGSGGTRGRNEDLYEAMRCLGQALHTMEDFAAHSNYIELALREQGHRNVFPHCGAAAEMNIQGHRVYPLVTGTFGMVDFLHSVLGEATDHLSQSEVDELDKTLGDAQTSQNDGGSSRDFDSSGGSSGLSNLTSLLSQIPGAGDLSREAGDLQAASAEQERRNQARDFNPGTRDFSSGTRDFSSGTRDFNSGTRDFNSGMRDFDPGMGSLGRPQTSFAAPPGSQGGPPGPGLPGMPDFDPQATVKKIYPILQFRDKVVRSLEKTIEKIPGLESLVEKITETVTLFVMSLLAPFIRPIITAITKQVKDGSGTMVDASGKHQFEPWTDPHCTDPTHSLLSKDHFANILNAPAGQVAAVILQYAAPRVLYAWQHPDIPVDQVVDDVLRTFHHPVLRDRHIEIHNKMFEVVENWSRSRSDVDRILSSESVKAGKHLIGSVSESSTSHFHGVPQIPTSNTIQNTWDSALNSQFGSILKPFSKLTGGVGGFGSREMNFEDEIGTETAYDTTRPPTGPEYPQEPRYAPQQSYQEGYQQQPSSQYGSSGGQYGSSGGQYGGDGGQYGSGGGQYESEVPSYGRHRTPEPPEQHSYGYGPPEGEYQSNYGRYESGPPMGGYDGYGGSDEYQAPLNPPPGRQYYGEQQGGGYYGGRDY